MSPPNMGLWCCCGGVPCVDCDDTTPAQYDITLSGITLCTCFLSTASLYDTVSYLGGFSANSTFRVSQDPNNSCQWTYTESSVLQVTRYSDAACTMQTTQTTYDFRLFLSYGTALDGTGWRVTARIGSLTSLLFYDYSAPIMSGSDVLCQSMPSFSNATAGCGGAVGPLLTDLQAGTGGSATATAV